ncbi:MAG: glutathione peroxidase [Planctomycetes bacterium]|nr:glutathione peroxidase [Planctomycetota bacterium]
MTIHDFEARTIEGKTLKLDTFKGKVVLIVNVASRCTLTRQYAGLEDLYQRWKDKGFVILGFPCNQFGHQEPGDEAAIKSFCSLKYSVSFPMFAKIDVNGKDTHPLYQFLKTEKRGTFWTKSIKWNFTKFLVDRDGKVLRRFGPGTGSRGIERHLASIL